MEKKLEQMEQEIRELKSKLSSMKLDMMLMESRQTLYRLENINMILSTQLMIKNQLALLAQGFHGLQVIGWSAGSSVQKQQRGFVSLSADFVPNLASVHLNIAFAVL